jgi:hypothetical protein
MPVLWCKGYEGGYDDVSIIEEVDIQPASDPRWYYGRYGKVEPETSGKREHAVLLFGRGRSKEM